MNGAGHDADAMTAELTKLLGLDAIGREIDGVQVFGRGTRAIVHIDLDNGERIVLDPVGAFTTINKLTAELALTVGASPTLKASDVTRVLVLIKKLGRHFEAFETEDVAWEIARDYLRAAPLAEIDMSDQAQRWAGFCKLEASAAQNIVLEDTSTGERFVRVGWITAYARIRSGQAEPILRALRALGWTKRGSEGRIKATQPGLGNTLNFKFFVVPKGWEE
jgi:hypothetical protein